MILWKRTFLGLALLLALCARPGQAEVPEEEQAWSCLPAAGLVKVDVKVEGPEKTTRTFRYTLGNLHTASISGFLLGTGEKGSAMQIVPANQPEEILAPPGWKGSQVFEEEGVRMHLLWQAGSRDRELAPGKTLEGLTVRMPENRASAKPLYDPRGDLVVPLDMKTAPFVVLFSDGSCAWGQVDSKGPKN